MRYILYLGIIISTGIYSIVTTAHIKSQEKKSIQEMNQPLELLSGTIDDYFSRNKNLDTVTQKRVDELSDRELAGMVLMPAYEKFHTQSDLKKWINDYHIGGFMVLRSDYAQSDKQYVESIYKGNLPLLVSIDAEPSLVKYRLPKLKNIPKTDTLDTTEKSKNIASEISEYILGIGVNTNFAPVYDNDSNQSVIGDRSYGNDPEYIHNLALAFSEETKSYGIIPTAKHFPGHGNVTGDTHKNLQTIDGILEELPQFELAIGDNVPMIMVGHLAIENNSQWETGRVPASLSKKIMTDLLKDQLGFKGLVITDALNMGALDQFDNVPIKALEAGADIVLLPKDIDQAFIDIHERIQTDLEFKKLIQEKAEKIIRMKLSLNNIQKLKSL